MRLPVAGTLFLNPFRCALFLLILLFGATIAKAEDVTLSLPQARNMAQGALMQGNPQLALGIAQGLLQADPNDAFAHYVMAEAFAQLGHPAEGRKAAARAFRYSDTSLGKFQSASLAAKLAFAEKRPTLAQYWLRRSLPHSPTDQSRERVIADYKILRNINPWNAQLRFSAAPSSNVNNGADGAYFTVDGLPFTGGLLSGDAQALSGVTGWGEATLSYRLRQNDTSSTHLKGRFYVSRVALSDEAKALIGIDPITSLPRATARDFGSSIGEVGLRHAFKTGGGNGYTAVELTLGKYWYGGDPYQTYRKLGLSRHLSVSENTTLELSTSTEMRARIGNSSQDTRSLDFGGRISHTLSGGDKIGGGVFLRGVRSDTLNFRSRQATTYVSYDFAKSFGPAKVSVVAGVTRLTNPDYIAFLGGLSVPVSRLDEGVFANVNFAFDKLDYAGFSPVLTLRSRKTRSNVSRFDTNELAISFAIQSSF